MKWAGGAQLLAGQITKHPMLQIVLACADSPAPRPRYLARAERRLERVALWAGATGRGYDARQQIVPYHDTSPDQKGRRTLSV
jgi:hypothetical protein